MMRQHGEKRTAGFTLLEVLVASAMASVLMLGLYHCFGTLVESGDRTESRLSALTAGRVFVDRMGVELRCAIKVQSGDEAPFVGDQNGLAFFTTASMVDPSVKAASALTHVAYKLDPGQGLAEGGGTVERTRQFFAGSKPISAIAGDRVLSGVEEWHVDRPRSGERFAPVDGLMGPERRNPRSGPNRVVCPGRPQASAKRCHQPAINISCGDGD